jgi:HK97 family phage portal protein
MGLFDRFQAKADSPANFQGFSGYSIFSGDLSAPTAIRNPVVASIVSLISNSVASMPLKVMQSTPTGTQSGSWTKEAQVLTGKPNGYQTPYTFLKTITTHLVTQGEAFLFKVKTGGDLIGLLPINPENVKIELKSGIKTYKIDGEQKVYTDVEILHILYNSLDGVKGYPQIRQHSDVINHDNTLRKFSKKYFSQSANPSLYLSVASNVSDEEIAKLKTGFSSEFTSVENTGKVPIIPDSFKLNPIASNAKDADLVDSLRYSLESVSRCWNVPSSKINSKDGANYASLEAENIAFLQNCIQPIVQCIESAIDTALFYGQPFFTKFNVNSILRSTTIDRYNAYRLALGGNPFASVNEIRALEDMNGIGPEGDIVKQMVNTVDINSDPTGAKK